MKKINIDRVVVGVENLEAAAKFSCCHFGWLHFFLHLKNSKAPTR